jgi:hypothetical membrane protein
MAVWMVWAGASAALVYLVAEHTWNAPFSDDWAVVPRITGRAPLTPRWLWQLHNEHRLPLPRLIQVAVLRLSGMDFRVTPYLSVAILSVLSLASIRVAARVRGRTALWDACLPLFLLSWVHADNVVSGWQIQFVLSTAAAVTFVLGVVSGGARPGTETAVLTGVAMLVLPLCGASGVIMTPVLTVWLISAGRRAWVERQRVTGLVFCTCAVLALGLVGLYLRGWQAPPSNHHEASPWRLCSLMIEFFALAGGKLVPQPWQAVAFAGACVALVLIGWRSWLPAGSRRYAGMLLLIAGGVFLASDSTELLTYLLLRPVTGLSSWQASGWLAFAAVLASLLILRSARLQTRADTRLAGLALFLLSMLALAAGIARGRAGLGEDMHMFTRYATLLAPLWCAVYFVWLLYTPAAERNIALALIFALSALMAVNGWRSGLEVAQFRRDVQLGAFMETLRHRTLSAEELAQRFTASETPLYSPEGRAFLTYCIRLLRDAGHPEFRRVRRDS